jgi:hypothetical protein
LGRCHQLVACFRIGMDTIHKGNHIHGQVRVLRPCGECNVCSATTRGESGRDMS